MSVIPTGLLPTCLPHPRQNCLHYTQHSNPTKIMCFFKHISQKADNPTAKPISPQANNPNPNVNANADVRKLCSQGQLKEAVYTLNCMQETGMVVEYHTYASLLQACAKMKALPQGKQLHSLMISHGIEQDVFLAERLLNMYAKCGSLLEARSVFDKTAKQNVFLWNVMIVAYVKQGYYEEALLLYCQMPLAGVKSDHYTFSSVLKACASLSALSQGRQIHDHIIRTGFESHVYVGNALVTMYGECNFVEYARQVFDKMLQRDVASWNAVITGYAKDGRFKEALELFARMQLTGIQPDLATMVIVVPVCARFGDLQRGKEIHGCVIRIGLCRDISVGNALIDMYGKLDSCIPVGTSIPTRSLSKPHLSSLPSVAPISLIHHFGFANANKSHSISLKQFRYRQCSIMLAAAHISQQSSACLDSSSSIIVTAQGGGQESNPETEYHSTLGRVGLQRNEMNLILEENPEQTLASIIKCLQALHALGITGSPLIDLVKKRPSIFTVNLERIVRLIEDKNIQELDVVKIHKVLKANPSSLADFPEKVELLLHHGLPLPCLLTVLNKLSLRKFCNKSIKELDGVLTFLKQFDLKNESCSLIIRRPSLLHLSLQNDLIPKTALFDKLDWDPISLKMMFRRSPKMFSFSAEHYEQYVAYFKSMGFTKENVFMIIEAEPQILSSSIQRKLNPRIVFLKRCGLSQDELFKFIIKNRSFLTWSFADSLSKKLTFLLKAGFPSYSSELAMALGAVTRVPYEKLQNTFDLLLSYGLSYDDIYHMSKKQPNILRYNCDSMKFRIEYLINDMKRSKEDLILFPAFLGYSLENRIKPRHETMKWLISKGVEKEDFSLNKLMAMSNSDFFDMEIRMGFVAE